MAANKMTSSNPEWHKRNARWRHNSFLGHCAMGQQNMWAIVNADSTTLEAKKLAYAIESQLSELRHLLKERNDDQS